MSIEQNFVQWYQQLSPTDQQAITNFLVQNLCTPSTTGAVVPTFGGRQVGPIGSDASKSIKCPHCHKEIKISG
jgi:hypothetical protein